MWKSRLFWKLFSAYLAVLVLSAAALTYVLSDWQQQQVRLAIEQRLSAAAAAMEPELAELLQHPDVGGRLQGVVADVADATALRITVTDPQGQVLADSERDPGRNVLDNHGSRPEIQQALAEKVGREQRMSRTLGLSMLYVARRIDGPAGPAGVVRMALSTDSVQRQVAAKRRLIMAAATGVSLLGLAFCYFFVARILGPVAQLTSAAQAIAGGDYGCTVKVRRRDELGELADVFSRMSGQLSKRLQQLRQRGEQLTTVLESMVEGVVAVDEAQRIMFANRAACELLELDAAKVQRRPLWEVLRHPEAEQTVRRALESDCPQQSELELVGDSRRQLSLHVVRFPGEPPPGLVLVLHDVTELRRLERLRQEFVANVSHELKTPLSSIKAYAETLREGAIADPQHNLLFVQRIERQAERLEQLILDMLSLARIEAASEPSEIEMIAVAKCVTESINQQLAAAAAKSIQLRSEPPEGEVRVRADQEGFREILDNLLDNAIKYTSDGGQVTVRWRGERNRVLLEVEDTGIGIAPADQQRIFERFYRVDRARSRELGGTGLGLAIVKHLAQAFGGGVRVQSQPGRGSTFTVELPAA